MNGQPLSRDHGFPLRVIVPGYIGARSVKFLQKILVQPQESSSFFQRRDYKILPPWIDSSNVETAWDTASSLGEMNVQCVICTPAEHEIVKSGSVTVKGYAISGGGRAIYRVELSLDGGRTWEAVDKIEQTPDPKSGMYWAWAIWEKSVTKINSTSELVARAYDSSGNIQPEVPIWNYRGVMNNSIHRVANNCETMGQVNSTEAPGSHPRYPDPTPPPPSSSSPSSSSSIPSVDDLRDMTNRILATTNDVVKNLRENIPAIELPALFSTPASSSSSSSTYPSGSSNSQPVYSSLVDEKSTSSLDNLGHLAESSAPVLTMTNDHQVVLYGSITDNSNESVTDLIRIHYQLSLTWVRKNLVMVGLGVVALGIAVTVGTVAVRANRDRRQKIRRARVLRGKEGAKREVVVVTNVSTLEGVALALSLEQNGFVVFVGVPNQVKADEVEQWRRTDIHPVLVDATKPNPVDDLVRAVSSFLDQKNSTLLGGGPISTSTSVIYEEEISASIANIQLLSPEHTLKSVSEAEAKRRHHGKTDSPLYRLAAVIVNPHSAVVGSIENVDLNEWRQSIDGNITGTVVAAQKFMPLLRRTLALAKPRRSPRLILLSSAITGSIGFPYQSAICASHHAIESIADSLRREIKPKGIDVICLRPGIPDTLFRKEWGDMKANAGGIGLMGSLDPTQVLKTAFKSSSTTTSALCEATYDAITVAKPASYMRVGKSSLAYTFVGWAAPRHVVDWSIKGKPARIHSTAAVKVTTTSVKNKSAVVEE
ncbi:hypothetical protein BG004_006615 [Podila humilis]|nr:hypothetical protein BG004_006615 [Podila humilis]